MSWVSQMMKQGRESSAEVARRLDSWVNTLSGVGTARDKTTYMQPGVVSVLSPMDLENLYATDDIAVRIVRAIVDECYREEWMILQDSDEAADGMDPGERNDEEESGEQQRLKARMKELEAWRKLKESRIWGRLYGKAALLLGADDGVPQEEWWRPLDEERVRGFNFLTVLDRRDLTPKDWYADLEHPKFGQIATYYVQPLGVYMGAPYEGIATNPPILVHESRLLLFAGELTNKRQRLANQGCDYSVLQKCYRALQLTNNNWQSTSTLLADAGQAVFKIRGLIDMIATNPDVMNSRMQLVDKMRSTVRAVILDAGDERSKTPPEDFTRIPTPFTGIPDMLEQTWNRLACAAKMPLMILMGSKPAGLNSDGEQDLEWWYNDVEGEQRSIDQPAIERLLALIAKAEGIGGKWTARPGALRRMSPAQAAKAQMDTASAMEKYVASGIYMPEEIALSLDKDPTGKRIDIDTDVRKQLMKASVDAAHAEREMAVKEAKAPIVKPAPAKPA